MNSLNETVDNGLTKMSAALQSLANGDLTARMHGQFDGSFAALQSDLNGTIETLADLIAEFSSVATETQGQARNLANQASDQAERAVRQAASLEETAATLEDISRTTQSSAKRSETAGSLAADAAVGASDTRAVAAKAVDANAANP